MAMVRWSICLAMLVTMAACNSDDASAPADDAPPTTTEPTRHGEPPSTTADSGPPDTTAAPDTTPENGADGTATTVSFDGVRVIVAEAFGAAPDARREPLAGAPTIQAVVIDLHDDVRLTVTPVRAVNGLFYEATPDPIRAAVTAVEDLLADTAAPGRRVVEFVTGRGVRADDAPEYELTGITSDGRMLVELTSRSTDEAFTAALDQAASTLVVDSARVAEGIEECTVELALRENVGVVEGEVVPAGETFVTAWRVENTGTCTWTDRYAWTFTGGDALTIEAVEPLEVVEPGATTIVSAALRAPGEPGRYAGQFQLFDPASGTAIGSAAPFIVVVE